LLQTVSKEEGYLQSVLIADQGFGELSQDFVSHCKAPESRDHVRPIPDLPADLQGFPIIVPRFPMVHELTVSRGDSREQCAVTVSVGCIACSDRDIFIFEVVLQSRLIRFEVAVDVSEVIMAHRNLQEAPNLGQELYCVLETLERLLVAVQL